MCGVYRYMSGSGAQGTAAWHGGRHFWMDGAWIWCQDLSTSSFSFCTLYPAQNGKRHRNKRKRNEDCQRKKKFFWPTVTWFSRGILMGRPRACTCRMLTSLYVCLVSFIKIRITTTTTTERKNKTKQKRNLIIRRSLLMLNEENVSHACLQPFYTSSAFQSRC